jgi:hypothetical protein
MPVLDVGTGVGYFSCCAVLVRRRFNGRGRPGEEESGSNGGSRDVAGRLVPAIEGEVGEIRGAGSVGSSRAWFGKEEAVMMGLSLRVVDAFERYCIPSKKP